MKLNNNAGFSLVEVLVAISILGILSAPVCTSLVLSTRMNTKTTELMQAQLAVSSAVETLMAEGIQLDEKPTTDSPIEDYDFEEIDGENVDRFPDVTVKITPKFSDDDKLLPYYEVTVTSAHEETKSVSVTTFVRERSGD